jgi:hypothetical protein
LELADALLWKSLMMVSACRWNVGLALALGRCRNVPQKLGGSCISRQWEKPELGVRAILPVARV